MSASFNRSVSLAAIKAANKHLDVLIIGGGASGLGLALDAASRGYTVALVERGDFAQETSSRSTKLIHGGVRYLEHGNVGLVREALKERWVLASNAMDFVQPIDFYLPCASWWRRWYYGAGLKLYDVLSLGYRFNASTFCSAHSLYGQIPQLKTRPGRSGAIRYQDAQFDDSRFAITLAKKAAEEGALLANYVSCSSLIKEEGMVVGAELCDELTAQKITCRSKVVINATGVFSDELRSMADSKVSPIIRQSQGAHIVLKPDVLSLKSAVIIPKTEDGRVLFAIPWHGHVLVGTTDVPKNEAGSNPQPSEDELHYLTTHLAEYFDVKIEAKHICSAWAGLRPLVKKEGAHSTAKLSRKHVIEILPSGLVSLCGGKWTTFRAMAEQTLDKIIHAGLLPSSTCKTSSLLLKADEKVPNLDYLRPPMESLSEEAIRYFIEHEMAITPLDILLRRTRFMLFDPKGCEAMATHMAKYFPDNQDQLVEEITKEAQRLVPKF